MSTRFFDWIPLLLDSLYCMGFFFSRLVFWNGFLSPLTRFIYRVPTFCSSLLPVGFYLRWLAIPPGILIYMASSLIQVGSFFPRLVFAEYFPLLKSVFFLIRLAFCGRVSSHRDSLYVSGSLLTSLSISSFLPLSSWLRLAILFSYSL
jgi:hypothetical protein